MSDYKIKNKGIKNDSEVTSAVSTISYEIENAKANGLSENKVIKQIVSLQNTNKFPSNLQYVDSFYDKKTSTSGVAFLDNNTGKVVVGFAGTNMDNGAVETAKDMGQWGNIAFKGDGPTSAYFQSSNKFMLDLKNQGYDINIVTGHSLGGRNGVIMGMTHNIPNVVLYNSAPLANVITNSGGLDGFFNGVMLGRLHKGYKGTITYFVSEKDPLYGVAGIGGSIYPGYIYKIQNGKGHEVTGFLSKEEQDFIRQHTPELNKLYVAEQRVKRDTMKKLGELDALRSDLLKSGGGLSHSEELYLDASEALILTEGMTATLKIEMEDIQRMYLDAMEDADKLWETTLKMAHSVGSSLSDGEALGALLTGGASMVSIQIQPKGEYKQKMSELTTIMAEYEGLISQITLSVNNLITTDQDLAYQLGRC